MAGMVPVGAGCWLGWSEIMVRNSNIFKESFLKVFKEPLNTTKIKAPCKSYMEALYIG